MKYRELANLVASKIKPWSTKEMMVENILEAFIVIRDDTIDHAADRVRNGADGAKEAFVLIKRMKEFREN